MVCKKILVLIFTITVPWKNEDDFWGKIKAKGHMTKHNFCNKSVYLNINVFNIKKISFTSLVVVRFTSVKSYESF